MGERVAQEAGDICMLVADSHHWPQQKLTYFCKAIILQFFFLKRATVINRCTVTHGIKTS